MLLCCMLCSLLMQLILIPPEKREEKFKALITYVMSCRMTAVAYLASYLSRAKFLSISFVSTMLRRLVSKVETGNIEEKR